MNNKFYKDMDDLFLNVYLREYLGLTINKLTILPSNEKEGLCTFVVYEPTKIPFIYKKHPAIGRYDNNSFVYEFTSEKDANYPSFTSEAYDKMWQEVMFRKFNKPYYEWHEDTIDSKILALKKELNSFSSVGRVLTKTRKASKNSKETREKIKSIQKSRDDIQNEIKKLESMRIVVNGKARQTPAAYK